MRDKLKSILKKVRYDSVIFNVWTNDSTIRTSDDMIVETVQLKLFMEMIYGQLKGEVAAFCKAYYVIEIKK